MTIVQRRCPEGEEPSPVQPPEDATTKSPSEPVPIPDPTPAITGGSSTNGPDRFTASSDEPLLVQARSAAETSTPWFRTPVLTKDLLDSICCMRLRTRARQKGPAGTTATEESRAYFEISVIGSDDLPKLKSPDSETSLTYKSHSAPATSDYEWTDGAVFEKDHEVWRKLEVGDCFEVTVCARGRGSMNDAEQGHLIFCGIVQPQVTIPARFSSVTRRPRMEQPFSKFKLRLFFFIGAIIIQIIAPLISTFDTSHLVPANAISEVLDVKKLPLGIGHRSPDNDELNDLNSSLPQLVPSPGLRWDALHYLDVALHGTYAYEHQYAFSPGIPIVLRLVHLGKELLFDIAASYPLLESMNSQLRAWLDNIINAFLVAMLAAQPSIALYRLTELFTHSKEFSYLTLMMHLLMSAPPVIIRSVYAEPFFAWFTFEGLSSCHEQRYLVASLYFGLATAFRTNGILLPCFILYSLLVHPVLIALFISLVKSPEFGTKDIPRHLYGAFRKLSFFRTIYSALLTIISLSPFIAQQYIAYLTFCRPSAPRPWCNLHIPLIYSFVQSHYWDVGPWRYWTVAQIPNFLLAIPILALSFSSIVWFMIASSRGIRFNPEKVDSSLPESTLSPLKALILLPYALHALVLSLMLLIAAHVQIALRILPAATPWISWAGAALIVQSVRHKGDAGKKSPSRKDSPSCSWWPLLSRIWIGWTIIWLFVSSVLWLAFLPPA
ncbi:hypothetical protein OPQ81_011238 [Rhizoctonia solani]|nr:hypothetical protein OPQ81_011238 [Rhizoctonia solani]